MKNLLTVWGGTQIYGALFNPRMLLLLFALMAIGGLNQPKVKTKFASDTVQFTKETCDKFVRYHMETLGHCRIHGIEK